MAERKLVMVSSTARDLPEHRGVVLDACWRQSFFPVMMEHEPASNEDAIEASLRMVDGADIYLGVLAHRYGTVPKGHGISITEMGYWVTLIFPPLDSGIRPVFCAMLKMCCHRPTEFALNLSDRAR
jgi:hypothetical protein